MIHLDTYLENFESKLEEIQNSIVYVKSYKKPKIRITRLSEERKFVPVEDQERISFQSSRFQSIINPSIQIQINYPCQFINQNQQLDIEINENLVIKDRFDWNLNDENVCIEDFVNELCDTLNLPEINRTRLKTSLIYQNIKILRRNMQFQTQQKQQTIYHNELYCFLIEYVERNTYYPRQKNKDQKNDDEDYVELNSDIKDGIVNSSKVISNSEIRHSGQYKEQEEEQKKTARQRKLDEMKRSYSSSMQPMGKASYIRDKRNQIKKIVQN